MTIIKCPQCNQDLKLIKHINKCQCGARVKVLRETLHKLDKDDD